MEKYLFLHGAALAQIVNHESFTSLNKVPGTYGHYIINTDRRLFIKYRDADRPPWQFNFQVDEVLSIGKSQLADPTYVAMVCGTDGVACVSSEELFELLEARPLDQQSVTIHRPPRGSYRIYHGDWTLRNTIARSRFPDRVIEGS